MPKKVMLKIKIYLINTYVYVNIFYDVFVG